MEVSAEAVAVAAALFGTGGVGALIGTVLTYKATKARDKTVSTVALSEREASFSTRLMTRIDALETLVDECEARHRRCEERVQALELQADEDRERIRALETESAGLAGGLHDALKDGKKR